MSQYLNRIERFRVATFPALSLALIVMLAVTRLWRLSAHLAALRA